MRFNPEEYRKKGREHFEEAWHRGPEILTPPSSTEQYPILQYRQARPHPIFTMVQRLRETYLSLGFDEICNPIIVEEQEVYRQFGPEASAVLDRVFYLGGLPRPNQGIGAAELEGIAKITGKPVLPEEEENLRALLQDYKKAQIDGDELTTATSEVLHIDDGMTVEIFDRVFTDFR